MLMDINGNSKELLIKDLCSRLPYGVKIMFSHNGFRWDWEQTLDEIKLCDDGEYAVNGWGIHGIKPYLRPMSSMTEEEKEDYISLSNHCISTSVGFAYLEAQVLVEWLNFHHFDFRHLIERGLALEAPKDMYKIE